MHGNGDVAGALGRSMRVLDLFSGIGALRLGFQQACGDAGVSPICVGFSEIDEPAIDIYRLHLGKTPALGDIKAVAASGAIPKCDVILAGFPCPAFSSAGNKRGFKVGHSHRQSLDEYAQNRCFPRLPCPFRDASSKHVPLGGKGDITMKRKMQVVELLKDEGAAGQKQAAGGQLTEAEVARLTEETAGKLLELGGGEAQDSIDKGRIIDEYVKKLQPNGKFSKPNPFTLLAEREDIPWRPSQLRTYRDTFLFSQSMGGESGALKVNVTTLGLVLPLETEVAKKIINRAVKEKLTTRQVAVLVKKAKGTEGTEKAERITGDWKVLGKAVENLDSEISMMLDCPPAGPTDIDVVDRLEIVAASITALIASLGPKDDVP